MWRGKSSLTIRKPWVVAFCFGLLHGFGFASALTSAGLPRADLPLALLTFNGGVELGQVAFVGWCWRWSGHSGSWKSVGRAGCCGPPATPSDPSVRSGPFNEL